MTAPDHVTTESEEMYLITVARSIEDGNEPPIRVSQLAEDLDVSPVSANQMVKKLVAVGLMEYEPYRGVTLTPEGERLASDVLRSRRLWGVFLADHLGLSVQRADEVACEMEHVTPSDVANRLSSFLGEPTTGPKGRTIPGTGKVSSGRPISSAPAGTKVTVVAAADPYDTFLASQKIEFGTTITVLAVGEDSTVLAKGPGGSIQLSPAAADAIGVSW